MTPNNKISDKLVPNEDKSKEITACLKKLVLEDNKSISYTYVSLRFGVHVKHAIQILDEFVAEERKNGSTLSINYLLSGNNDSADDDNEIKMERFMIVSESDIESTTDWFKNGFNKHIYSVGFGEDNHQIELNFDEFDYEVNDKNKLKELHNLRYIKNPNIEFRNVCRRVGIKPIVHKNEEKPEKLATNSNDSKETETKSKPKTNSKAKNTKKNKISNMFSKNKKDIKSEDKIEDKESDDPFGSDSEEETKPKVESTQPSEVELSDEEEVKEVKTQPIVKSGNKRQSKNDSNGSEDEEIISTKKRGKKYKRVRLISESDSDDNKEDTPLDKFVSNKKENNSKPQKKVEEVKETHVDEDGYVVTKTVKKEVEDKESENSDKSEDKSETNEKSKQKVKNTEKVEKKAPKPKETKSKGQSSITSFFKPKIST